MLVNIGDSSYYELEVKKELSNSIIFETFFNAYFVSKDTKRFLERMDEKEFEDLNAIVYDIFELIANSEGKLKPEKRYNIRYSEEPVTFQIITDTEGEIFSFTTTCLDFDLNSLKKLEKIIIYFAKEFMINEKNPEVRADLVISAPHINKEQTEKQAKVQPLPIEENEIQPAI